MPYVSQDLRPIIQSSCRAVHPVSMRQPCASHLECKRVAFEILQQTPSPTSMAVTQWFSVSVVHESGQPPHFGRPKKKRTRMLLPGSTRVGGSSRFPPRIFGDPCSSAPTGPSPTSPRSIFPPKLPPARRGFGAGPLLPSLRQGPSRPPRRLSRSCITGNQPRHRARLCMCLQNIGSAWQPAARGQMATPEPRH
jgi:hypothetical protein